MRAAVDDRGIDTVDELLKRRRARNWAVFALLLGFCVLIYIIALVKMGAF